MYGLLYYCIIATDCETDIDCAGMAALAYCDGTPRRCLFYCDDSLHCADGICTQITRFYGQQISVCMDECDGETGKVTCNHATHVCVGVYGFFYPFHF